MKKWIGVGVAAALALGGVSACGQEEQKNATAVCFDEDGDRLPDTACQSGNSDSGNEWLWFVAGMMIPRIGQNYHSTGVQPYTSAPKNYHYYYGGAPTNGGKAPAKPYSGSSTTPKPSATVSPKSSAKPSTKPSAKPSVKNSAPATKPKPAAPKAKPPSFTKPKSGGSFGKSGGFSGGGRKR